MINFEEYKAMCRFLKRLLGVRMTFYLPGYKLAVVFVSQLTHMGSPFFQGFMHHFYRGSLAFYYNWLPGVDHFIAFRRIYRVQLFLQLLCFIYTVGVKKIVNLKFVFFFDIKLPQFNEHFNSQVRLPTQIGDKINF